MNTQHSPKAEILVERLDDIPLLISLQQRIGLGELIDEVIPRHGSQLGLSIGQLVVGWTAYILSEADHRKVAVEDWATEHQSILSELLGVSLRRTDFTDDRLGQVSTYLSKDKVWEAIETKLWANSVNVYQLSPQRVRLDATRLSGYHTPTKEGLMQHGYNRKTPELAQVKLMAASIDCGTSGHLLATDVTPGDKADDGLYLPVYRRIRDTFLEKGLLYTGDSKMSALKIRGEIASDGDFYLVPLAKVGEVAKHFDGWVSDIVEGGQPATLIYNTDAQGQRTDLIAFGYQTTRCQQVELATGETYTWDERILVVRSLSEANKQFAALERNIAKAEKALLDLTPEPKQGRRQIRRKADVIEKAEAILAFHGVSDYLSYTYQRKHQVKTQYIGRGRGSRHRPKRQVRTVRYQITQVSRDEAKITAAFCKMGWKLYATNSPKKELEFGEAVRLYRAAPRIERHFHLFKDAPIGISPMYVRTDDQIKGLVRLLSLCVRLLTLIEIVPRRHLAQHQETLAGLYEGNPNRTTASPTAVRLLKAFVGIHRVRFIANNKQSPYVTPLTPLQQKILCMLCISESVYHRPLLPKNKLESMAQFGGEMLAQISVTFNRIPSRFD